jgi:ribosomal-protein-alanine N-acetyltransferase
VNIEYIDQIRRAVPFVGERVELRFFTEQHINEKYINWLNDPEVVEFSNQRFNKHDEKTSAAFLTSFIGTSNHFFAIHMLDDDAFVGTMTAYVSIPHETVDIGIMIGERSCWSKGIGSDAWSALMSGLLEGGKVRKVTGGTLRCNIGMVNIMLKSGMKPDGVRHSHELVKGVPQDILYYSKFRDE